MKVLEACVVLACECGLGRLALTERDRRRSYRKQRTPALTERQEKKLQEAVNTCTDRETGGEATGSSEQLH